MNFTRSNEEYAIIGKITEAKELLMALNKELVELEFERTFPDSYAKQQREDDVLQDDVPEPQEAPVVEETLPTPVVERKPIGMNQQLCLIQNDEQLAMEISSGTNTNVLWGAQTYVSSWSRGKKYDPKNVRISLLRREIRCGRTSIRQLSVSTGLAIDTIKDLVREMDKQGFFLHK